ncbi:MAG: hypothetical protein HC886_17410 [Leptolyngbyaceae cyanobacterium SM1_1_3]|nr:hypothetical protein [Leptolyngbyaceae cyanobacterium SM1_1_3]NJN02709.1 hypothetical protein [Leptolyngbyaceae cyanobacterium RM1_1_2]NJO11624.1 hypothetical protein [Leptolyngbyaceae cyanobacterium SL_1_1]
MACLITSCAEKPTTTKTWDYSQFIQAIEQDQIVTVTIESDRNLAIATTQNGEQIRIDLLPNDPALIDTLTQNNIRIRVAPPAARFSYPESLIWLLIPSLISLAVLIFWIWVLIDCATKEASEGNTKIAWILIILFASGIGALIYVVFRRPQRLRELGR